MHLAGCPKAQIFAPRCEKEFVRSHEPGYRRATVQESVPCNSTCCLHPFEIWSQYWGTSPICKCNFVSKGEPKCRSMVWFLLILTCATSSTDCYEAKTHCIKRLNLAVKASIFSYLILCNMVKSPYMSLKLDGKMWYELLISPDSTVFVWVSSWKCRGCYEMAWKKGSQCSLRKSHKLKSGHVF